MRTEREPPTRPEMPRPETGEPLQADAEQPQRAEGSKLSEPSEPVAMDEVAPARPKDVADPDPTPDNPQPEQRTGDVLPAGQPLRAPHVVTQAIAPTVPEKRLSEPFSASPQRPARALASTPGQPAASPAPPTEANPDVPPPRHPQAAPAAASLPTPEPAPPMEPAPEPENPAPRDRLIAVEPAAMRDQPTAVPEMAERELSLPMPRNPDPGPSAAPRHADPVRANASEPPDAPQRQAPEQPKAPPIPAPPSVRVDIGEVRISLRQPEQPRPRPALSVVRRGPRQHAIPLAGFGED